LYRVKAARHIDERALSRIPWAYASLDEYDAGDLLVPVPDAVCFLGC